MKKPSNKNSETRAKSIEKSQRKQKTLKKEKQHQNIKISDKTEKIRVEYPELKQYKIGLPDVKNRVHENGVTTLYVTTQNFIRPVRTFMSRSEVLNYTAEQLRCDIHFAFNFEKSVQSVQLLSQLTLIFQPYKNGINYQESLDFLVHNLLGVENSKFKIFDYFLKRTPSNEQDFTHEKHLIFELANKSNILDIAQFEFINNYISDYHRLIFDLFFSENYYGKYSLRSFFPEPKLSSMWELFDIWNEYFFDVVRERYLKKTVLKNKTLIIDSLEIWFKLTRFLISYTHEELCSMLPAIKIDLQFNADPDLLLKLKQMMTYSSANRPELQVNERNITKYLWKEWCFDTDDYSLLSFYSYYVLPSPLDGFETKLPFEESIETIFQQTMNLEKTDASIDTNQKYFEAKCKLKFFNFLICHHPGFCCQYDIKDIIIRNIDRLQNFIDQYSIHLENTKHVVNQIENQWNPNPVNKKKLSYLSNNNVQNIQQILMDSDELQSDAINRHQVILGALYLNELNEISKLIHFSKTYFAYFVDQQSQTYLFQMESIWNNFIRNIWFHIDIVQTFLLLYSFILLQNYYLLQLIIDLLPSDIRFLLYEKRTSYFAFPVNSSFDVFFHGFEYNCMQKKTSLYDAIKITKEFQVYNGEHTIVECEEKDCVESKHFEVQIDRTLLNNNNPLEQWKKICTRLKSINCHQLIFHCDFLYANEEGEGFGVQNDVLLKIIEIIFSNELRMFKSIDPENSSKMYIFNNKYFDDISSDEYILAGQLFALALLTVNGPIGVTFPRSILNYLQNHREIENDNRNRYSSKHFSLTDNVCYDVDILSEWKRYEPKESNVNSLFISPIEQMKDMDIEKYNSLKNILLNRGKPDHQVYELDAKCPFTHEDVILYPICEENETISPKNIDMYIDHIFRQILFPKNKQIDLFRLGYQSVECRFPYGPRFLNMTDSDIHKLMLGTDIIDISWWKQNTQYISCDEQTAVIKWFWNCIEDRFDNEQRMKLIEFVTNMKRVYYPNSSSSSTYHFEFKIQLDSGPIYKLPYAATCQNLLNLSDKCKNMSQLCSDLKLAIQETQYLIK